MKNSLFIGRFQPFHLGHLHDVKTVVAKGEFCIIAIGSANRYGESENPLTASERKAIILEVLRDENVDELYFEIVEIDDIGNDVLWPSYVEKAVMDKTGKEFDLVYTGSVSTKNLFEKYSKKEVCFLDLIRDENGNEISASLVREKVLNHVSLDGVLHKKCIEMLEAINFQNRLIEISKSLKV